MITCLRLTPPRPPWGLDPGPGRLGLQVGLGPSADSDQDPVIVTDSDDTSNEWFKLVSVGRGHDRHGASDRKTVTRKEVAESWSRSVSGYGPEYRPAIPSRTTRWAELELPVEGSPPKKKKNQTIPTVQVPPEGLLVTYPLMPGDAAARVTGRPRGPASQCSGRGPVTHWPHWAPPSRVLSLARALRADRGNLSHGRDPGSDNTF